METESSNNSVKVTELQGAMDVALDDISHFLRTQMDGTTAHRLAMKKVLREEKEQAAKVKVRQQNRPMQLQESSAVNMVPLTRTNSSIHAGV